MTDSDGNSIAGDLSRWNRLPVDIWEKIFTHLPVSSLAISTSVCQSWRSIIRSPPFISIYPSLTVSDPDIYFLLHLGRSKPVPTAVAYHPYKDRWVQLTFPAVFSCPSSCCHLRWIHSSGGSSILSEQRNGSLVVCNIFTGQTRSIAPMISLYSKPYVIALLEGDDKGKGSYKIVAVSTLGRVHSQLYDSGSGNWVLKGELLGQFAVLGNSALIDGVLYCLSRGPDFVLGFDTSSGDWWHLDVLVPNLVCMHVLEYKGELHLVGGVEELGEITGIRILKLDWSEKRWKDVGFMPEGLFRRFSGFELNHFVTVDRRGVLCFCNTTSYNLLVCDLSGLRWWRPVPCPFPVAKDKKLWLGHAVEPCIEEIGHSHRRSLGSSSFWISKCNVLKNQYQKEDLKGQVEQQFLKGQEGYLFGSWSKGSVICFDFISFFTVEFDLAHHERADAL